MASIHQDKRTKIWCVRYTSPDGKRLSKSLQTKIKDVAEDRLKGWQKDDEPKLMVTGRRLSDLLEFWKRQTTTGEAHKEKVETHWKEFQEYFDDVSVSEMTRDMINDYYIYWKEERTVKGGGLAAETYRNNFFRSLRLVWRWSIERKHAIENIFIDIKNLKTAVRKKSLSPHQLGELLNAAADKPLYQKFLIFMLLTGCRPSELWKLKHADRDHKNVFFYDSKTGDTTFPITTAIENVLSEIKALQTPDTEFVFSNENGEHMGYDTVGGICRKYLDDAGFKDYRPYDIRHTVITLWASELPAFKVKRLARHKHISTTMGYIDESALDISETDMNILTYGWPKDKVTGERPRIITFDD